MIENNPMNNEASRKKMAATLKGMFAGVKNPMYGKSPGHGKWQDVQTPRQGVVRMRSTYEKIFAEWHNMVKRDTIERMEKYVNAHQEN